MTLAGEFIVCVPYKLYYSGERAIRTLYESLNYTHELVVEIKKSKTNRFIFRKREIFLFSFFTRPAGSKLGLTIITGSSGNT